MHFVSTLPSLLERNANRTNNVIFLRFYQLPFLVSLSFNSSSKPYALLECLFSVLLLVHLPRKYRKTILSSCGITGKKSQKKTK